MYWKSLDDKWWNMKSERPKPYHQADIKHRIKETYFDEKYGIKLTENSRVTMMTMIHRGTSINISNYYYYKPLYCINDRDIVVFLNGDDAQIEFALPAERLC